MIVLIKSLDTTIGIWDPNTTSDFYLDKLPNITNLKPFALETLKFLKDKHEVGIVTNGFSVIQKRRILKAGIAPHIDFMISSDESKNAKPHPEIFDLALNKMSTPKEQILFIGDRPTSDILGAYNYGMDSCWYNPHNDDLPQGFTASPTHEITCLSEIQNLHK